MTEPSTCWRPVLATSLENGYPTTEELVYYEVSEQKDCNSYAKKFRTKFYMEPPFRVKLRAKCTLHSVTESSIATAEHINSSVVG
jgi:hypothetical protein